jgi:hypothetical protein
MSMGDFYHAVQRTEFMLRFRRDLIFSNPGARVGFEYRRLRIFS